ncbi:MAG: hypothetical protein IJW16_02200 [Clostridia bacterium]|nr:hypothetical protein [Clostridia bacterium]
MRANTNVAQRERRELRLQSFRGADLSSSPHEVSAERATYMRNFMLENGRLTKRPGWEERLAFSNLEILGMYPVIGDDGKEDLLFHDTSYFYTFDMDSPKLFEHATINRLKKKWYRRGMGFYNRDRFFHIGSGEYLMWGIDPETSKKTLMSFEDYSDPDNVLAYIPTTTVNISNGSVGDSGDSRKHLDDVNLFTGWRKNKLIGFGNQPEYVLDAEPKAGTNLYITIEVAAGTYRIEGKAGEMLRCVSINGDEVVLDAGRYDTSGKKLYLGSDAGLSIDMSPSISEYSNITVLFYVDTPKVTLDDSTTYSGIELINSMTLGATFGTNGNSDRLFLGGSDKLPNRIYYSAADDFTYFPDTNYITVGSSDNPITDMIRMSDGTLAVMKKKSALEHSVFYVTSNYQELYNDDGNLVNVVTSFPVKNGYIGESSLHPFGTANLAGEQLILSENGVFGISLVENVSTVERNTFERSYPIREELLRHDLSNAVATVYKDRYYLAVDGLCFVADARYKYVANDSRSGAYHYDWWIWDNIPATCWTVLDGKLAFGTEDGMICTFEEGTFSDMTYQKTGQGAVSICAEGLTYDTSMSFTRGDQIRLINVENAGEFKCFYRLLQDSENYDDAVRMKDRVITIPAEKLHSYAVGMEVGVEWLDLGDPSQMHCTYGRIVAVDYAACTITLAITEPDVMEQPTDGWTVFLIDYFEAGTPLYVVDITDDGILRVSLDPEGEPLVFYSSETVGVPTYYYLRQDKYTPVTAEWRTPIFDLGTQTRLKSLIKMTVTAQGHDLSVGYRTRRGEGFGDVRGGGTFDLADFDFSRFTLEGDFAKSDTRRVHERHFNYIQFLFRSEGAEPCRIDAVTATYKITKTSKGVK